MPLNAILRRVDLERQLLELEQKLLRPEVRASREAVAELLDDGFVEHGASGRIYDKQLTLDALAAAPTTSSKGTITSFRARRLSPGVALATYRLVEDGIERRESIRSSIWCERDGRWRLAFHQGTPGA